MRTKARRHKRKHKQGQTNKQYKQYKRTKQQLQQNKQTLTKNKQTNIGILRISWGCQRLAPVLFVSPNIIRFDIDLSILLTAWKVTRFACAHSRGIKAEPCITKRKTNTQTALPGEFPLCDLDAWKEFCTPKDPSQNSLQAQHLLCPFQSRGTRDSAEGATEKWSEKLVHITVNFILSYNRLVPVKALSLSCISLQN